MGEGATVLRCQGAAVPAGRDGLGLVLRRKGRTRDRCQCARERSARGWSVIGYVHFRPLNVHVAMI